MTVSNAVITQGTLFQRGSGTSPESFVTIAEVRGFRGLGGAEAPTIDVTHFLSTRREKRIGLPDEGTLTLDLNFVPGDLQQQGLEADRAAQAVRNFKITFTDTTTVLLAALVKTFEKTAEADDVLRATVSLEVTGEPAWQYPA